MNQTPLVSVLVAAWNEEKRLPEHIASFLRLDYPAKELVLCAGGTDNTYKIALEYTSPMLKVVEQRAGEGKQKALARCLEQAAGQIIYLTDADCILNSDAFIKTLSPIIHENAAAVSGSLRPTIDQSHNPFVLYQWAVDRYGVSRFGFHSPGLLGSNCAVRADVLRTSGGFDTPAPTGTDYTLARQIIAAGYSIRNVPDSEVETIYPVSIGSYYFKRSRWLRNLFLVGWRTGDRKQFFNGLKSVLIGWAFIGVPLLTMFIGPTALVIWILLWGYACAARIRYVLSLGTTIPSLLSTLVVAFASFWLDIAMWSSIPFQLMTPKWRQQWR